MDTLQVAMHNLPGLSHHSIFVETPSFHQLIAVSIIVGVALIMGIFVKRVVLVWLQRVAEKTQWKGDDIIIDSIKNVIEFFFILTGAYFSVFYLPFTEKWSVLILKFIEVAFVLLVTVFAAKVATKAVRNYQQTQDARVQNTSIFTIVVRTVIYILGGLIILQGLGISITPLLTALGVGGLAVALALQDTLSNLFAGLQILAAKNIQVNDFIQLENGDEGHVADINWRTTTIRALPNRLIIIPNNKLATSIVENFSKPDLEVSVSVEVGVSYSSDLDKVERVALEVAREVQKTHGDAVKGWEPAVRFHTFDAYSINLTVGLRAKEFTSQFIVKSAFIKLLHKRFLQEGIDIPFPITTVELKKN
ncbi:MAG: mechanosensitive ion channel family protein [Breznakibacter sp.]